MFIQKYGTPTLLANADADDLRALLTPLGITSRAKTLIDIANILMAEHKGLVPQSYDELINLPGVGDYIASCVLALSYKQPVPMVDVNVARVIRRICGANVDIRARTLPLMSKRGARTVSLRRFRSWSAYLQALKS